ncbi:MAG: 8-amino-7-oxononanoate synthase [Deltaproteobacteria bacterium]|nr:8-amino-7-oxononanoate synthase [Deltaproteobacteria bacterium]
MTISAEEILAQRLERLDELSLRRSLRVLSGRAGVHCRLDGRDVVNFSSNDYLGLAGDTDIGRTLAGATAELGSGAGASRLVGGHHEAHAALEREFADWMGAPRAVFLPSGYHANIAALTAVCGPGDTIFSDELNHASIVDGCRLSGASVVVYRHADAGSLAEKLGEAASEGLRLVVTESIFSVDGDEAPLAQIAALKRPHGFLLMIDEAHAIGCYGPGGRGLCAEQGISREMDLLVGTFGKAVGASGAAIACGDLLAELAINRGRTFMFTTATPPAVTEMVRAAIRRARDAEDRRKRLRENAALFRAGCQKQGFSIPGARAICPVILGAERRALLAMERLWDSGFYVQALRPPTVPAGACRLRISVSAAHTTDDIGGLAAALTEALGPHDQSKDE